MKRNGSEICKFLLHANVDKKKLQVYDFDKGDDWSDQDFNYRPSMKKAFGSRVAAYGSAEKGKMQSKIGFSMGCGTASNTPTKSYRSVTFLR